MKDLKQVTVIGLGLLGGSITLRVSRSFSGVKAVGYTHRASTRRKARKLGVAGEVFDDMKASVRKAGLVILATPVCTFEGIFAEIGDALADGCIVTDVGSTKVLPHRWASKCLPKRVHYVGSHPIAGSEQRGVEYARDDLFERAMCILTSTKSTSRKAVARVKRFWEGLGCSVKEMRPAEHDKIFSRVSHLPHVTAAALINSNSDEFLKFAGKGLIDTTRIASGPANIWADIFATNSKNVVKDIDKIIKELRKLRKAVKDEDKGQIGKLLEGARQKRASMMKYKMKKKELIS